MGEKITGLARESCSTKEHIRAIDGSVPVEEAPNLRILIVPEEADQVSGVRKKV